MVELEGGAQPGLGEMPGNRHRAAVEAAPGQIQAQLDDPLAHRVGRQLRRSSRPARARLKSLEPALPIALEQALQVLAAHPRFGRSGRDRQLLGDDLEDGDPVLRHGSDCHACRDSPVAYHLSPMS